MAILNPDHLFDQAELLIRAAAPPRQADLKRAISTAYYGLFHAAVTSGSNLIVGSTKQTTPQYTLVYRSADHKRLRDVCEDVGKGTAPDKIKPYVPTAGFGQEIKEFADTFVGMQEKRHTADYDPSFRAKRSDAEIAVRQSRAAVLRLQNAPVGEREAFLFLLLFRPR